MKETLRTALAMGADRGIHVEVSSENYLKMGPLHVSQSAVILWNILFLILLISYENSKARRSY